MLIGTERLIGAMARLVQIHPWQLDRLVMRGLIPEPSRVGRFRVFTDKDIPIIRAAAIRAGYLRSPAELAETS